MTEAKQGGSGLVYEDPKDSKRVIKKLRTESEMLRETAMNAFLALELKHVDIAKFELTFPKYQDVTPSSSFTFSEVSKVIRGTLPLLADAHALGVVHGDISIENIMHRSGNEGGEYVLNDWGSAFFESMPPRSFAHKELYLAPEQKNKRKKASTATDVWALGVSLHALLTDGCVPVVRGDALLPSHVHNVLDLKKKPQPKTEEDKQVVDFICRCLSKAADIRLDTEALMQHPVIVHHYHSAVVEMKDVPSSCSTEERDILFRWLVVEISVEHHVPLGIMLNTLRMIDAFCAKARVEKRAYQLVALAALYLSYRLFDVCDALESDVLLSMAAGVYSASDLTRVKNLMIVALGGNLYFPPFISTDFIDESMMDSLLQSFGVDM